MLFCAQLHVCLHFAFCACVNKNHMTTIIISSLLKKKTVSIASHNIAQIQNENLGKICDFILEWPLLSNHFISFVTSVRYRAKDKKKNN